MEFCVICKYFNDTSVVPFIRILFSLPATIFYNNLDLCSKSLKLLFLAISALKLLASSLE